MRLRFCLVAICLAGLPAQAHSYQWSQVPHPIASTPSYRVVPEHKWQPLINFNEGVTPVPPPVVIVPPPPPFHHDHGHHYGWYINNLPVPPRTDDPHPHPVAEVIDDDALVIDTDQDASDR